MDRWDIVIIAAAGYVAVTTLVRLMAARRNQLVDQVRKQVAQQRVQQVETQQVETQQVETQQAEKSTDKNVA